MKPELDRIDFQILDAFQKDVRISNKELASLLGLAPSTCFARVQRLRAEGVLAGAHARVDPEALGIGLQAMVGIRLRRHDRKSVKAFWKHALAVKEVLAVYLVTGDKDLLVQMAVRDIQHLQETAMDAFASRPEVASIETSIIFDQAVKPALPNLRMPEARAARPRGRG